MMAAPLPNSNRRCRVPLGGEELFITICLSLSCMGVQLDEGSVEPRSALDLMICYIDGAAGGAYSEAAASATKLADAVIPGRTAERSSSVRMMVTGKVTNPVPDSLVGAIFSTMPANNRSGSA